MTDPIADMLTRIRNALVGKKEIVEIPVSNIKKEIAKILLDEGYINGYEIVGEGVDSVIKVELKYGAKGEKVITGLKRVSKPGLRIYAGYDELPKVLGGMGVAIVSTPKGVMTDRQARKEHHGGEILVYVW
ncbi:MAG: 30S ribosomal protein S8 [Christensenellaceae bacterium]